MNYLQELKQKVHDLVRNVKSIDALFRDKVDPYILIDEVPCPVAIGKKIIWIGNFNLDNENEFFCGYVSILANLGLEDLFIDLISKGEVLYKYLAVHKALQKDLCRLIHRTVLKQQKYYLEYDKKIYRMNKCSYRYFRKHMTKEKLMQICLLIYQYNYDAVKKNLSVVLNKMGAVEIAETYIYSWLGNCPGLTGKFVESQSISSGFSPSEYLNHINSKKEKEKVNG